MYTIDKRLERTLSGQIADQIKQKIMERTLNPGDQLPTEVQLSKELGVSRTTVRQAFLSLAKEGLIIRRRGQGSFVANLDLSRSADVQELAYLKLSSRTRPIVYYFQEAKTRHSIFNPFYPEALDGLLDVANVIGFDVSYFAIDPDKKLVFPPDADHSRLGAVILSGVVNQGILEAVMEFNVPILSIHEVFPRHDVCSVVVDNVYGGFIATEHLIKKGARQIALIGGDMLNTVFLDRYKGYKMALEQHGLPVSEELVLFGNFTIDGANVVIKEFLDSGGEIDAVFVLTDAMAIGVMTGFWEKGLSVPDDILVVGYDDHRFAGMLPCPLSTVHQPRYDVGKKAGEIVARLIRGDAIPENNIVLKPELIIRQSSCREEKRRPAAKEVS